MKKIIFILSFFICFTGYSQLTLDAGKDSTICRPVSGFHPFTFGGNPTASGGAAPYTYTWECNYTYTVGSYSALLTASDFLSDTTASNPDLIYSISDSVTFYLSVNDNNGATLTDSIKISFSNFGVHLAEYSTSILQGDSAFFGGVPNIFVLDTDPQTATYLWRPNHGLTDSTSYTNFWVKPTVSNSYYVTITDAVGCEVSGTPVFHVGVGTANIESLLNSDLQEVLIYPNPSNGKVTIEAEKSEYYELSIYDPSGKLVYQVLDISKSQNIDISDLNTGIYTFILTNDKETVSKRVILKD